MGIESAGQRAEFFWMTNLRKSEHPAHDFQGAVLVAHTRILSPILGAGVRFTLRTPVPTMCCRTPEAADYRPYYAASHPYNAVSRATSTRTPVSIVLFVPGHPRSILGPSWGHFWAI